MYKRQGHLISNLDPLGLQKREKHSELKPESYGFLEKDFSKKIFLDGVLGIQSASLQEILSIAKETYCRNIGFEFMHMSDPDERTWIRDRIEGKEKSIKFTLNGKKAILNKLVESEGFEKFLHVKFVGTKRFGLDGAESLIPALEQIIKRGGNLGVKEVKIGMPHRGRLNVLANMMQKPFKAIFKEFFGEKITSKKDAFKASKKLLDMGIQHVIITLGDKGSIYNSVEEKISFCVPKVKALDSTAAGYVFNGYICKLISEGENI